MSKPNLDAVSVEPMSRIQPWEENAAKKLINDQFMEMTGKSFTMSPGGYMIAVKIFVRPEELKKVKGPDGKEVVIYRAMTYDDDKYQSVSALVCATGPDAYKGENRDGTPRYTNPWCKVGDWVVIPRHECFLISYRGVAMGILPDDKIIAVIDDPTDVMAPHLADRI